MKVYVAGRFSDKDKILEVYKSLESLGHEVSYDWTGHKPIKPYHENQKLASEYSQNEVKGIYESDIFIYLSDKGGTTLPMEFGAALILLTKNGKPAVYAIGEYNDKSPWFFNPLVKRRDSIDEVLEELKS